MSIDLEDSIIAGQDQDPSEETILGASKTMRGMQWHQQQTWSAPLSNDESCKRGHISTEATPRGGLSLPYLWSCLIIGYQPTIIYVLQTQSKQMARPKLRWRLLRVGLIPT